MVQYRLTIEALDDEASEKLKKPIVHICDSIVMAAGAPVEGDDHVSSMMVAMMGSRLERNAFYLLENLPASVKAGLACMTLMKQAGAGVEEGIKPFMTITPDMPQ